MKMRKYKIGSNREKEENPGNQKTIEKSLACNAHTIKSVEVTEKEPSSRKGIKKKQNTHKRLCTFNYQVDIS